MAFDFKRIPGSNKENKGKDVPFKFLGENKRDIKCCYGRLVHYLSNPYGFRMNGIFSGISGITPGSSKFR